MHIYFCFVVGSVSLLEKDFVVRFSQVDRRNETEPVQVLHFATPSKLFVYIGKY